MSFSKKRGRPALNRQKDRGTKELQAKRLCDATMEALDLCLKKGLISETEHAAGLKLRWLYGINFGRYSVTAYNPNGGPSVFSTQSEGWLDKCKQEYSNALTCLAREGCKPIVLNICVFNMKPGFLLSYKTISNTSLALLRYDHFSKFTQGMKILAKVLGKESG